MFIVQFYAMKLLWLLPLEISVVFRCTRLNDNSFFWGGLQDHLYLPAHQMDPISLDCILLGILCQGCPCHHLVVRSLSRMPFQHVELCMDPLGQFLVYHLLGIGVLGLGEVIQVLQLAIIYHTNKALNSLLGVLGLISTFQLWKIPTASHLLVVHYLNLGLPIMSVLPLFSSIYLFSPPWHFLVFLTWDELWLYFSSLY